MQYPRRCEQAEDVAIAGFGTEPTGDPEVMTVAVVFPAALFGNGFENLRSGSPAILGCLGQTAGGQFLPCFGEKVLAELLVLLAGHLGILRIFEG